MTQKNHSYIPLIRPVLESQPRAAIPTGFLDSRLLNPRRYPENQASTARSWYLKRKSPEMLPTLDCRVNHLVSNTQVTHIVTVLWFIIAICMFQNG